jgi:UDP-glucuronate 4-epimerase
MNKKIPFSTKDRVDYPVSLYAATKKSNEIMAYAYSHLYGIPMTGLRFFTVYGPWGRPDMAYYIFTKAILEGNSINVFNEGKMERDFTYITDILNGINSVLFSPPDVQSDNLTNSKAPFTLYNIGNNSPVKLLKFIQLLEQELGMEAIKNFLPMQDGDVPITYADSSELINKFNYQPDTPLEEGIKNFVRWYKNYYLYK